MIQDQNFREEQQNILNNPQSLQMIKQNLYLLMLNDKTEISDIISNAQFYLSSITRPSQSHANHLSGLQRLQYCIQQLKERISQKSYHFCSIIQLSIRMINYISELRIKSQQDNQSCYLQIDRLQSTIEDLTNRNTIFEIDIQNFKEQLQHAREQIDQIVIEKQNLQEDFIENRQQLINEKDMRIYHLQKELEDIKHNITVYKNLNKDKDHLRADSMLNDSSIAKSIKRQPLDQGLNISNFYGSPMDYQQVIIQPKKQHELYVNFLQKQNNALKLQLNELKVKFISKKSVNMSKTFQSPPINKLKTLINQQSNVYQSYSLFNDGKTMFRSYTSKFGINTHEKSQNKEEDISTFLQLLRIDKNNRSIRRDLSRQSLLKTQPYKIEPFINQQQHQHDILIQQRKEEADFRLLRNDESKSSFVFKRDNKYNECIPHSSSLVYLTQQQQLGDNQDKQKYQWFFKSEQLDNHQLIPSSTASIDRTDGDKSYSSVGVNTLSSSFIEPAQYLTKSKLTISKNPQIDKRPNNDKQLMPKRQESKSFIQLISDFVVKKRIKKAAFCNMQINKI